MTPRPDYTLAVTVLILAVLVIGASIAAAKYYAIRLGRAPRTDGLLMWHVVTIGVSVALTWLMLGLGQLDIMGIIHTPRPVRLVGYGLSGVGTIAALILIALLQRRAMEPTCPAVPDGGLPDSDAAPPGNASGPP